MSPFHKSNIYKKNKLSKLLGSYPNYRSHTLLFFIINNSYKILFFISIILGTLISISSSSWLGIWIGLEINLLSFIPLIIGTKNLFSSESSLKYFLTQALASAIFLFTILIFFIFFNSQIFNFKNYFSLLISSTILIKIGSAPFHFWFPSVTEGLNWSSILLLITWQKIAPIIIFSYLINFNMLIFIVILSIIFGRLGGLNQSSLRKLIAFSSINHLGWIMISLINREFLWITYFLFYCFLNFRIIWIFNKFKLININQTFYLKKINILFNLSIFISLLSLGGLPPFLGFFPKWIIIEILSIKKLFFILIFMLFFTLITLFFYLRIFYNSLLLRNNEISWNYKIFKFKNINKFLLFISFFSIFGLIFINIFYLST